MLLRRAAATATSSLTVTVLAVAVLAAACGDEGDDAGSGGSGVPVVVATTSILGDLVQNVLGDCATVEVLLAPGTDPHEAELSAQQAALLREADVVFAFGLGLEEHLEDALQAAEEDGVEVVEVSDSIEALPLDGDPHVWQDPSRMADVVGAIGTTLTDTTDCDSPSLTERTGTYQEQLLALDDEVAEQYAAIPADRRVLVTNHDAFGYLADRYDLRIVGTVIPGGSTLAEPSAADLADLVAVIEREQVPAIFGETLDSTALVDALAAELDEPVEVVELHSDSLGAPDSDAATYVDLVRSNAARISGALVP